MQVFLFAHIPPGKFERFYQTYEEKQGFPWFNPDYNKKYLGTLQNYSDVLHLQLYGHHHTDMFKLITDGSEGNVVGVGLLAPAVTPWLSTLAPETGANNPALRLFKYNNITGEVIEFPKSLERRTKA